MTAYEDHFDQYAFEDCEYCGKIQLFCECDAVNLRMRYEIEIPEPSNIIAFEVSNDQTNPDQPTTRNNIPEHLSPGNE